MQVYHAIIVVIFWVAFAASMVFRRRCKNFEEGSEEYAWNLKMQKMSDRASFIAGIINLVVHFGGIW